MSAMWLWLKTWIWNLVDALPPYGRTQGPLQSKDRGMDGKHYIYVNSTRIHVDGATFDKLSQGDELIVRYTKGQRAISIDLIQHADNHIE